MIIKIDQLSKEIMDRLTTYTADIVEGMNAVGERATREGVAELSATSPKRTGKYRRGWSVKAEKSYRGPMRFIVHNKARPRLTHLLEHGHATRDGGRTRAQPHIDPVGDKVAADYLAAVEDVIRRGS
ncbi:MAG: HK97 gp10 family phage protein [Ammonifex sp.]|nr:MAG: HK97 gp10 family phage protein [Ammonifex sp.]